MQRLLLVLTLGVSSAVGVELPDIVGLAAGTTDLSTLVVALKAGKLTGALSGTGPFTVFAPTNEAFAKLPKSTLDALLDPKNIKELDRILEYHVVADAVFKADIKNGEKVKTLEGQDVEARISSKGVFINQAKVITADVEASNGVVHIIDAVLLPPAAPTPAPTPATKNIVELAESVKDLSTLVAAVVAGGLADTLSSPGPFTVFAPTNEAFAALPAGVLSKLMKPESKKELVDILTYHVLSGKVLSTDLKPFQAVKTVEGKSLHVTKMDGAVRVGPSSQDLKNVIKADNLASNGVVHIIDGVLLPPAVAILV